MDENVIVYIVRVGYEIKSWIYADDHETDENIKNKAKQQFKDVGVEVLPNDIIEWEWF